VFGRPIWEVQQQIIPNEMQPENFLAELQRKTYAVLRTGQDKGLNETRETAIQLPNGERRFLEVMMYTYKTDRGYRVGSISRDITERKQAELRLEYLAMHDSLTGLPNRQLFHDRLTQALERARRENHGMLAVMLLDLDNFKEVNDTYGHAYGDQLLKIVAQRLNGSLRKSDTAARMGGDEFTLINEEVDSLESCTMIAKKVLSTLSESMKIGDKAFHVTASLGISLYPFDGTNAAALLRHADIAMYRAKGTGDAYRFYSVSE
jgi:diguanylate cyclase